jgi:hypothetical protein
MAGRNQAHIDLLHAIRADWAELAFLQDAQQLLLHLGAHVPDLIEEQRATIGGF